MSSKSIVESLYPIIFTSKLFGFSLFTINPASWLPSYEKIDFFATIFFIFMNILLNFIYWTSSFGFTSDGFTNKILEVSAPLLIFVDYLINATAVVWFFIKRKKICKLLKIFNEIDENFLTEFDIKFDYKKSRFKLLKWLLALLILISVINTVDFVVIKSSGIPMNNKDFILVFWNFYAQNFHHFNQIVAMHGIKRRLQVLNHLIKLSKNVKINELSKIHLKIVDAVHIFNQIFPPITMLYFANLFCWLCLLIFDMATCKKNNFSEFFQAFAMNVPHSIYLIGILYLVIKTAESVKTEVRKCLINLCEINNGCERKEMKKEIGQFSYQIVNVPMEFSSGLIDYDWKFMFKVRKLKAIFKQECS